MKTFIDMLLVAAAAAGTIAYACVTPDGDEGVTFSPASDVEASLTVSGPQVLLKVKSKQGESEETIAVETEKKLKLSVEDYNFDGHKDFAISHVDDGMGTYETSQVYIYSCLLYTSPSPRDGLLSRMPSSA